MGSAWKLFATLPTSRTKVFPVLLCCRCLPIEPRAADIRRARGNDKGCKTGGGGDAKKARRRLRRPSSCVFLWCRGRTFFFFQRGQNKKKLGMLPLRTCTQEVGRTEGTLQCSIQRQLPVTCYLSARRGSRFSSLRRRIPSSKLYTHNGSGRA